MDNEKYYTPEIIEYHEGFEYEYSTSLDGKEWIKTTFDIGCGDIDEMAGDWHDFSPNNRNRLFRVKFLSSEDIVKCGWKFGTTIDGFDSFYKNSNILFFSEKEHTAVITEPIGGLAHLGMEKATESVFRGTIKNINELRTLMQMLNIK